LIKATLYSHTDLPAMAYQQTTPPPVTFMQFATYKATKAASAVEKFTVVDTNGLKFSVSMAPLTDADVASVLLHIWSYQNKTAGMTFTTFETEHELFSKTLTGLLMADWTAAVEAIPAGVGGLTETIKLFIPKVTMGMRSLKDALITYIANIRKDHPASHRDIKVLAFYRIMQCLNRLADYLPGNDALLTAAQPCQQGRVLWRSRSSSSQDSRASQTSQKEED
jgi:hypothetical protein